MKRRKGREGEGGLMGWGHDGECRGEGKNNRGLVGGGRERRRLKGS